MAAAVALPFALDRLATAIDVVQQEVESRGKVLRGHVHNLNWTISNEDIERHQTFSWLRNYLRCAPNGRICSEQDMYLIVRELPDGSLQFIPDPDGPRRRLENMRAEAIRLGFDPDALEDPDESTGTESTGTLVDLQTRRQAR